MKNIGFMCFGMGIQASVVAVLLKFDVMEIKSPENQALAAIMWFIFASVALLIGRRRRR